MEKLAFNVAEFKKGLPEDCPPDFAELVIKCTQFNPDDRPEFKEVVIQLENMIKEQN